MTSSVPKSGDHVANRELSPLDRGLRILSFIQDRGSVTAAEVIEATAVPSSSAYRYLRLLRSAGFVSEIDGALIPSARLADRCGHNHAELMRAVRPIAAGLAEQTGLDVALTVRVHCTAVCLDARQSGSATGALRPGAVHSLHAGAGVTPLLAVAPEPIRGQVLRGSLRRFTASTPDSVGLQGELAAAQTRGYHLSHGWLTPGRSAVGMPIMVAGAGVAALSMSGRSGELDDHIGAAILMRQALAEIVVALEKSSDETVA
ncbi:MULTISPECIES: IclR family transcriptional regulator [unclassified Nocardia]|uniref:IclR family transcriptional regulator n=1 Tax=unclassified Nocardia TaxID=2637762 RepID=UPI0035E197B5